MQLFIRKHPVAQLETIQLWHVDVGKDQKRLYIAFVQIVQRIITILEINDLIFITQFLKYFDQQFLVVRIIFDYDNNTSLFIE